MSICNTIGLFKRVDGFPCESLEMLCRRLCGNTKLVYKTYAEQLIAEFGAKYAIIDDILYEFEVRGINSDTYTVVVPDKDGNLLVIDRFDDEKPIHDTVIKFT